MDVKIQKLFTNRKAVIATMHQKEQVIAPVIEHELGLSVIVPDNFNSDVFGTFTNEVERAGDQLEAARKKLELAMNQSGVDMGIASEGSFGRHPVFSFTAFNRELILFIDKKLELEITGYIANGDTNFLKKEVKSFEEAYEFALSVGFPEHGVIVKKNTTTTKPNEIIKGIMRVEDLKNAVSDLSSPKSFFRKSSNTLSIETDMRAMYNPTRMKNIKLATEDLVTKIKSFCPSCETPGFSIAEVKKGLLCQLCGFPTYSIRSHVYQCKKCTYQKEVMYPNGNEYADPTHCSICNP